MVLIRELNDDVKTYAKEKEFDINSDYIVQLTYDNFTMSKIKTKYKDVSDKLFTFCR
jgi:hypothetical protein